MFVFLQNVSVWLKAPRFNFTLSLLLIVRCGNYHPTAPVMPFIGISWSIHIFRLTFTADQCFWILCVLSFVLPPTPLEIISLPTRTRKQSKFFLFKLRDYRYPCIIIKKKRQDEQTMLFSLDRKDYTSIRLTCVMDRCLWLINYRCLKL